MPNAKHAKCLPSSLSNLTNAKLKPVSSPAEITCISHFKSVIPKITSTCTCNKFYCRIIIGDHLTLAADADKLWLSTVNCVTMITRPYVANSWLRIYANLISIVLVTVFTQCVLAVNRFDGYFMAS